ncbi:MAG: hypothetical protein QOD31_2972 [Pseudonocardiales bacterium]|nr:hypothetical protein [Pseudonocardiales bacterium]
MSAAAQFPRRPRCNRLDRYLLHLRRRVPLQETIAGSEALIGAGAIRHWGVSNFDVRDVEELVPAPPGNVLRKDDVNAIPKAGTPEHVVADRAALASRLTDYVPLALDAAFPPPLSKQ